MSLARGSRAPTPIVIVASSAPINDLSAENLPSACEDKTRNLHGESSASSFSMGTFRHDKFRRLRAGERLSRSVRRLFSQTQLLLRFLPVWVSRSGAVPVDPGWKQE